MCHLVTSGGGKHTSSSQGSSEIFMANIYGYLYFDHHICFLQYLKLDDM